MNEITAPASDLRSGPARALGLYVHVPFCASTCDFCAFYQTRPTAEKIHEYLRGIADEARLIDWPAAPTTVFWGGGTPGLLSPDDLRRLGAIIHAHGADQAREWTVEMAPASVTDARLAALKEIGVTRISMGVQSFQPALLDALGRQHTLDQVERAYERIRRADFASVNLDLMFALPGQNEPEWLADLEAAIRHAPDHISTYCLTFEEDTRLWVKLSEGRVKLDPEHEARLYELTWRRLAEAGFAQYEVSNFARPGHACQHNLNTWGMREWVGLGPSAASQHGGWRGANIADLDQWAADVGQGRRMTEDRVRLTPSLLLEDSLIFGLRTNAGVDLTALQTAYPVAPWQAVRELAERLVNDGLATLEGGRLSLTNRGRLLADSVGGAVMESVSASVTAT